MARSAFLASTASTPALPEGTSTSATGATSWSMAPSVRILTQTRVVDLGERPPAGRGAARRRSNGRGRRVTVENARGVPSSPTARPSTSSLSSLSPSTSWWTGRMAKADPVLADVVQRLARPGEGLAPQRPLGPARHLLDAAAGTVQVLVQVLAGLGQDLVGDHQLAGRGPGGRRAAAAQRRRRPGETAASVSIAHGRRVIAAAVGRPSTHRSPDEGGAPARSPRSAGPALGQDACRPAAGRTPAAGGCSSR